MDTSEFNLLRKRTRPSMAEISIEEFLAKPFDFRFSSVQLKYDGWFAMLSFENGKLSVGTTGLHHVEDYDMKEFPVKNGVFLAEWMFGTQWAGSHNPGSYIIRDVVSLEGQNIDASTISIWQRHKILQNLFLEKVDPNCKKFLLAGIFSIGDAKEVWEKYSDYEGIVNLPDYGYNGGYKIKHSVEDDFIVFSINRGGGKNSNRMGGMTCGKLDKEGNPVILVIVGGGFSDETRQKIFDNPSAYIGKVCTITGKAKFSSGSLRHPNFKCFRDDKLPNECRI